MGATAEKLETPEQERDPAAVDSPPPPVVPPRLTREERLELENLALKVENIRLQQERLRQDFVTSTRMLRELQKEAQDYQFGLGKKYGVDLAHSTIQSDGSIIPAKPEGVSDIVGASRPHGLGG